MRKHNAAHIQSLREALGSLSSGYVQKLNSLAQSADGEFFWEEILQLGRQYRDEQETEKAGIVFSFLLREPSPEGVRKRARLERDVLLGQGSVGRCAESFLSSFAGGSHPLQGMAPLIAGSAFGQVVSAAAFHRLLAAGSASFFTRGLGAKLLSGILGAAAEVPFFAWAGRPPSGAALSEASSWRQAALTAGGLRLFGWAGRGRVVPQISALAGLAAVQGLEMAVSPENRPGAAAMTLSIFDAMIRWSAGSAVAHGMLGAGFAAFQRELAMRSESRGGTAPKTVFAGRRQAAPAMAGAAQASAALGKNRLTVGALWRMASSETPGGFPREPEVKVIPTSRAAPRETAAGEPTTDLSLDEFVALSLLGEIPADSEAGLLSLLQDPNLASHPAARNLAAIVLPAGSADPEPAGVPSLSAEALGGNLESLRILGERGRKDPAAVRELIELEVFAGEYQSGAEKIGDLEPLTFRFYVLQALGSAASEDADALTHLVRAYSSGVVEALEPIFAVAEGDFVQTPEARDFLLQPKSGDEVPILEGLLEMPREHPVPDWDQAAEARLATYFLGGTRDTFSLRSRMVNEFPALQAVLALANRGHREAREALEEWRDFRHYESLLTGGPGSAEMRGVLSDVAKLNSRLKRVLQKSSAPAKTGGASPSASPEPAQAASSPAQTKRSTASPSAFREKPPKPSENFVKIHRVINQGLLRMSTLAIHEGELYRRIETLGKDLPLREKRILLEEWVAKLTLAVERNQAKQQVLFFDAIHALSHSLSSDLDSEDVELRADLILRLLPVRKRLPVESQFQLGLLCLSTCGEMGHIQSVVPRPEAPVDFATILRERESEGVELRGIKRILNEIHRIPEGEEKAEPYGRLDTAIEFLKMVELRRLADEATEELRAAARDSLNAAHWGEESRPKFIYRSKIAVLSNLLRRVFRKMGPGESPRFVARLQRDERLVKFNIGWLSSHY